MTLPDSPSWRPHVIHKMNGDTAPTKLAAEYKIVNQSWNGWNRVAAVPYIVYMPEKDRLLIWKL